jgi:hypothetical protein
MSGSRVVARLAVQTKRGIKRTCTNETCGSHYYDLMVMPPTCPYCGAFCKAPTLVRVDFETLGKQRPHRYNAKLKLINSLPESSSADLTEIQAVDAEVENEPAIPSASEDLLIDDEDEAKLSDESAGEVT